jgi:hypothetical protein
MLKCYHKAGVLKWYTGQSQKLVSRNAREGSTPSPGTHLTTTLSLLHTDFIVTARNKLIVKYRLMGLGIIVLALVAMSFTILLVQEQLQYSALARQQTIIYR